MRKFFAFSLMAALVLASCSPNEKYAPTPQPDTKTVRATIESATRTYLVEDTDIYHVYWKSGDKIRCTDDNNGTMVFYGTTDNGVKSATFTWLEESGDQVLDPTLTEFWAYYPAVKKRALPAVQQYEAGGIAAAPMRGYYKREAEDPFTAAFDFKHLCGAIKLNLTTTQSDVKIVSIVLRASNGLSGTYGNTASKTYYEQVVSNTDSPVTLDCPEVAIGTEPVPFFISVPPFTYTAFSVTVYDSEGRTQTRSMKANEELVIERAQVYELDLAFNDLQKPAVGATATFMKGSDMNAAIKALVNPDVSAYTEDDSTVTRMVFVTNSNVVSATNLADPSSESPIYVLYDEATTTVTVATPAPKFVLNTNSAYFFHRFKALTQIEGIEDFDTSNVESMAYFWGFSPLKTIKMPASWDYSKLMNYRYMFDQVAAETIDLSDVDFSADTTLAFMFYYAEDLNEIIWPAEVNLENCESMQSMFRGTNFALVDLTCFKNTSGLLCTKGMFAYCPNLMKVVADLDLSAVTGKLCEDMFGYGCDNVTKLDLTEFGDISTTTTCYSMFYRNQVAELDLSTWDTNEVNQFGYTFMQMLNLRSLYLGPDFGFTEASGGKPSNTCMFAGSADKTSNRQTASVPGSLSIYTVAEQAEWLSTIGTLNYIRTGYYNKTPITVTFYDCNTQAEISVTWPS